ncbi:uncharacterized protein LOC131605841 [Vicia villosa]|uniref:uncharacterized protein LOC131605841 n=1 Tax=Vicia villosa TaxID=3911 RepID=UPI00273A7D9C|nr:uncharacterized protein LOC131605841 [Vicia villosa]
MNSPPHNSPPHNYYHHYHYDPTIVQPLPNFYSSYNYPQPSPSNTLTAPAPAPNPPSFTYINNHYQTQYSSSHSVETFHTFKVLQESINDYFETSNKLTDKLKEQIQAFSLSLKASCPEVVEEDQEELPDQYQTQLHHLNLMPTQVDVYEDEEKSKMHALEENQQENLLQNLFPTNHTLTLCDSDFVPCLTVAKSETPPFPSKSSLLIFNLEYTFLKFGIGVVASFNIGRDWPGFCYAAPISCSASINNLKTEFHHLRSLIPPPNFNSPITPHTQQQTTPQPREIFIHQPCSPLGFTSPFTPDPWLYSHTPFPQHQPKNSPSTTTHFHHTHSSSINHQHHLEIYVSETVEKDLTKSTNLYPTELQQPTLIMKQQPTLIMKQDEEKKSVGEESPPEPPPRMISDQPPVSSPPLKPQNTVSHQSPPPLRPPNVVSSMSPPPKTPLIPSHYFFSLMC